MIHTLEECKNQFPTRKYIEFLNEGSLHVYDFINGKWYNKPYNKNERVKCMGYYHAMGEFIPIIETDDFTLTPLYGIWDHLNLITIKEHRYD